jgi:hypothetical protein
MNEHSTINEVSEPNQSVSAPIYHPIIIKPDAIIRQPATTQNGNSCVGWWPSASHPTWTLFNKYQTGFLLFWKF